MKYYWLVHFNYVNGEENTVDASRLYLIKHYLIKSIFSDMIPDLDEILDFIQLELKDSKITLNSISITRRKA